MKNKTFEITGEQIHQVEEYLRWNRLNKALDIHTKDKAMKIHLKDAIKEINKEEERKWSEYELRLLIQDEMSCKEDLK